MFAFSTKAAKQMVQRVVSALTTPVTVNNTVGNTTTSTILQMNALCAVQPHFLMHRQADGVDNFGSLVESVVAMLHAGLTQSPDWISPPMMFSDQSEHDRNMFIGRYQQYCDEGHDQMPTGPSHPGVDMDIKPAANPLMAGPRPQNFAAPQSKKIDSNVLLFPHWSDIPDNFIVNRNTKTNLQPFTVPVAHIDANRNIKVIENMFCRPHVIGFHDDGSKVFDSEEPKLVVGPKFVRLETVGLRRDDNPSGKIPDRQWVVWECPMDKCGCEYLTLCSKWYISLSQRACQTQPRSS